MLTFGRGDVFSLSSKQKVNSTSYTVAKSIDVDDNMNFVMWVKLFMEQQGLSLPIKSIIKNLGSQPSVLHKDNTSSIRLKAIGKKYSTKRTQNINIRYFYITDKIKSGDVLVVYHPTGKLIGDFLTKPLNRSPFKNHRYAIMGVDEDTNEYYRMKYEKAKVEYRKRIKS